MASRASFTISIGALCIRTCAFKRAIVYSFGALIGLFVAGRLGFELGVGYDEGDMVWRLETTKDGVRRRWENANADALKVDSEVKCAMGMRDERYKRAIVGGSIEEYSENELGIEKAREEEYSGFGLAIEKALRDKMTVIRARLTHTFPDHLSCIYAPGELTTQSIDDGLEARLTHLYIRPTSNLNPIPMIFLSGYTSNSKS